MRLDVLQGSQEWLNFRRNKITSTDAGIILGSNKFNGNCPYLLWKKKMGLVDDPIPSNKMLEGSEMEDIILCLFETQTDKKLIIDKNGMIDKPVYQSDEYPWMIASLDGEINDHEYVEAKGGEAAYKEAAKGNIPDYTYDQVQHTLLVKGFDLCHLCHYRVGKELIHMTVKANKEYQKKILKAEQEFYEFVKTCTPPPEKDLLVVEDGLAVMYEELYQVCKENTRQLEEIAERLKEHAKDQSVQFKNCNVRIIKVRGSMTTDWKRVQVAYAITDEDLMRYKKEKAGYDKIEVKK